MNSDNNKKSEQKIPIKYQVGSLILILVSVFLLKYIQLQYFTIKLNEIIPEKITELFQENSSIPYLEVYYQQYIRTTVRPTFGKRYTRTELSSAMHNFFNKSKIVRDNDTEADGDLKIVAPPFERLKVSIYNDENELLYTIHGKVIRNDNTLLYFLGLLSINSYIFR